MRVRVCNLFLLLATEPTATCPHPERALLGCHWERGQGPLLVPTTGHRHPEGRGARAGSAPQAQEAAGWFRRLEDAVRPQAMKSKWGRGEGWGTESLVGLEEGSYPGREGSLTSLSSPISAGRRRLFGAGSPSSAAVGAGGVGGDERGGGEVGTDVCG